MARLCTDDWNNLAAPLDLKRKSTLCYGSLHDLHLRYSGLYSTRVASRAGDWFHVNVRTLAAQLAPAQVAMEACGSAHHWGRWFAARGQATRLIAPEFVVPFRKGRKNDTADAEAVAIAARQPTMRFVRVKTADQQAMLAWYCAREGWKEKRIALLNRVRGLLAEYGVVIPRSPARLLTALPALTEDPRLPDPIHALLLEVQEQRSALHARLAKCDAHIAAHAKHSTAAQRAMQLTGVGPVTASALAATVPDARVFRNGRRFGTCSG